MIDEIRQNLQDRLEELLTETERIRRALHELGSSDGDGASAGSGGRRSSRRTTTASRRGAGDRRTASADGRRGPSRARGGSGGTKSTVLATLASADGQPMTAGEVASATGLGRASVSTTLSKLARSGEVTKASRGYQLVGAS